MALFPFSLPSANGTPSLHLYLPHLPMSRIFRSRESASDDRSPGGLPGRSGRTRPHCAGVHEHAWGQGPGASRGTTLELRDVLVGALAASHTGLKRVLGRLDLNRRRLGGTLGLTQARCLALGTSSLADLRGAYCHLMPQGGYAIEVGPLPRYPGRRLRYLGALLRYLGLLLGEGRRRGKHREKE